MIIDTHSHLQGHEFEADFADVIQRARDAGVKRIVLIGQNPEDTRLALSVARNHDVFRVVAGVHPHKASEWSADVERSLRDELASDPLVVGIGETGLDYHYDFAPRDKQREAFLGQLRIAQDTDKPVVIHCREAYEDCLQMFRDFYGESSEASGNSERGIVRSRPRGVMHCYFGSVAQAEELAALGFMLGIGGSVTFRKAEELHEVVRRAPLEQIVLETDAPYMAPVPYRGKRNESSYLPLVVARIAELKGISPDEVTSQTARNASLLFRGKVD